MYTYIYIYICMYIYICINYTYIYICNLQFYSKYLIHRTKFQIHVSLLVCGNIESGVAAEHGTSVLSKFKLCIL